MLVGEFNFEITRLSNHWPRAYTDEFKKLLWKDIGMLSKEWLVSTIDRFIGSSRVAPMIPDFQEFATIEREKLWAEQKKQNTLDAQAFWSGSVFSDEEKKSFFKTIRERIKGSVSNDHWNSFVKILKETSRNSTQPKEPPIRRDICLCDQCVQ